MWAHLNAEPPSVREQRPDVPEALDDVIRAALAKRPTTAPRPRPSGPAVLAAVGETPLARSTSSRARSWSSMMRPSADPGGAVVGGRPLVERLGGVEQPSPRRAVLAGGVGRPGRGDERHRDGGVPPAGLPDRSCSTGMSAGLRPSKTGHALAAIRRPGRVGVLGHPHERARGVEAEQRRPVGLAGRADRHRLAALDLRPVRRQACGARHQEVGDRARGGRQAAPAAVARRVAERREGGGREVARVQRDRVLARPTGRPTSTGEPWNEAVSLARIASPAPGPPRAGRGA